MTTRTTGQTWKRSENLVQAPHYDPETGTASVKFRFNGEREGFAQAGTPSEAFLNAFRRATGLIIVGKGFQVSQRDNTVTVAVVIGGEEYKGTMPGGEPEQFGWAYAQAIDVYAYATRDIRE